jgi:ferredoxin
MVLTEVLEMSLEKENKREVDIFNLLKTADENKKKKERNHILESLNVKEFFENGTIFINKKTCRGVECKLCIDACPTHALYWIAGEVQIDENLCVYCTACVLCCIVDDCILIRRKRSNGEIEEFSTPRHVHLLLRNINLTKKSERINSIQSWNREIHFPSRMHIASAIAKLRKEKPNSQKKMRKMIN